MIIFKRISWRNFLSTGNVENSIDLNQHTATLITGKNGEGKSTLLCALTFGLYGRPFRNINKPQLINSINRKHCEVTIDFAVNGHNYRVRRGMKPSIFEIYRDGELITEDAASKDYQKVLEQQILKLNYKTFTQVVILGSATFVPFMQLKETQRREVIEDILDIRIFSVMNQLLKEKSFQTRDEIIRIEGQINSTRLRIEAQQKLLNALVTSKKDAVATLQTKIADNTATIQLNKTKYDDLMGQVTALKDTSAGRTGINQLTQSINDASVVQGRLKGHLESCEHDMDFYQTNATCPSCVQVISEDRKRFAIEQLESTRAEHAAKLQVLEDSITKLQEKLKAAHKTSERIRALTIEASAINNTIELLTNQNVSLTQEIGAAVSDSSNIDDEQQKLSDMSREATEQTTDRMQLVDLRSLQEVAGMLLKDTGIKTAIIREYLPVLNKLINEYLGAMDFFVKFELDESFQEVIRSRGRDVFTYDSFSEGEKRRIDLAILFTWRQIAKMKNSVNTNLMILDEILDGSLDGSGIDYFLSIMNQFGEHTNVFVISHKVDQMIDRFDHVIRVEKKNDFSVIANA